MDRLRAVLGQMVQCTVVGRLRPDQLRGGQLRERLLELKIRSIAFVEHKLRDLGGGEREVYLVQHI